MAGDSPFDRWFFGGEADALNASQRRGYELFVGEGRCVSCHVIGFGDQTGFTSVVETPALARVGCESCHGPSAEHVGKKVVGARDLGFEFKLCHVPTHRNPFDFEKIVSFLEQSLFGREGHLKTMFLQIE